jgi:beta-glucanase (GH16 family)
MLPTDWKYGGWPHSGEIDIMEHVGFKRDSVFATAHTASPSRTVRVRRIHARFSLPDAESAFHVYAVEWKPEQMDFYVDDVRFNTVQNLHKTSSEWPFDQRFHLILNLAVGGNWGGMQRVWTKAFGRKKWKLIMSGYILFKTFSKPRRFKKPTRFHFKKLVNHMIFLKIHLLLFLLVGAFCFSPPVKRIPIRPSRVSRSLSVEDL